MSRIASVFWLLVGLGVSDVHGRRSWLIWTITEDREQADSNATVYIHLIDAKNKISPPLELSATFKRGKKNDFVFFDDVCAIRIYRDNSGDSPNWFLLEVGVKAIDMKDYRTFYCYCWVPTEQEENLSNHVIQRSPPCSAGPIPDGSTW